MKNKNEKNRIIGNLYHLCVIKSSLYLHYILLIFWGFGHCYVCSNHILVFNLFYSGKSFLEYIDELPSMSRAVDGPLRVPLSERYKVCTVCYFRKHYCTALFFTTC